MRRLYQKIYLTVIVSLLLVVLGAGALWRRAADQPEARQAFEVAGELAATLLPPADASIERQMRVIKKLARRFRLEIALFDENRNLIAATGPGLPIPPRGQEAGTWIYGPGGPAAVIRLPDKRWLSARTWRRHRHPALGLIIFLGGIALVVGICGYPVVRGLTRRLERLQAGVETLGKGDLMARVKVEGKDEIAQLASSFNDAAARIEELVGAHRLFLANASHELRTPLSRLRLGIELLKEKADPERKAELETDIGELDQLIDEILLASRLDTIRDMEIKEEIDLLALAAEECARYAGCFFDGEAIFVRGDPRLVRRMVRNLLDNAEQHGKPPIRVELQRQGEMAVLDVMDHGPGIPESERRKVFLPFYRSNRQAATKGSGLGLSLIRQIARRHGGDALIAERPDGPNCFRVTLPATGRASKH